MVKKKTIMIVDDEKNLVEMVSEILKTEGFKVLSAYNSSECMKLLKKNRIDLIILDLMMPNVDGWMVHRRIKENGDYKNIPILILTAKTETIDKDIGIEIAKVEAYMTKPFEPTALIDKINSILKR